MPTFLAANHFFPSRMIIFQKRASPSLMPNSFMNFSGGTTLSVGLSLDARDTLLVSVIVAIVPIMPAGGILLKSNKCGYTVISDTCCHNVYILSMSRLLR